MRRKVTLEIDPAAFSEAFRTMTGQEAKDVLVMLVCGGHSVSSHSACLRDVGIRPAAPAADPAGRQAEIAAKVASATESFLSDMSGVRPGEVLDGLADRPRAGAKQKARAAFTRLLRSVHMLRTAVEASKPLQLVGSGDAEPSRAPAA